MDVFLPILATILVLTGFVMNKFGDTTTSTRFVLNLVGDALMNLGLAVFLWTYMPKGNVESFQEGTKDWQPWPLLTAIFMLILGFGLNVSGVMDKGKGAGLNLGGDAVMLLGTTLLFFTIAPPHRIEKFQTWVKTPAAARTATSGTAPAVIPDPLNARYDTATGEVNVDNLPSGMDLVVYWKGGTTPPEGPPFNAGTLGGWRFGASQTAQIGQGATNVRVRFATPDHKGLSKVVNVP